MYPCLQGIGGERTWLSVYRELIVKWHVSLSTGNWWWKNMSLHLQGIGGEKTCLSVYRELVVTGHVSLSTGNWWWKDMSLCLQGIGGERTCLSVYRGIGGDRTCLSVYRELVVTGHVSPSTGNWRWQDMSLCLQGIGGDRTCLSVYSTGKWRWKDMSPFPSGGIDVWFPHWKSLIRTVTLSFNSQWSKNTKGSGYHLRNKVISIWAIEIVIAITINIMMIKWNIAWCFHQPRVSDGLP